MLDRNSEAGLRSGRAQWIGIDFHEARFALCAFPTARLCGNTNELSGGQGSVDPLGASAIGRVRLFARWIVTGINAKH